MLSGSERCNSRTEQPFLCYIFSAMHMNKRILQSAAAVLFFAIALRAADDPIIGTWKLNLVKSNPAALVTFRALTAKVEPRPNGLKVTQDLVNPQGMIIHSEFTAQYDGMDYPVTGDPYSDTVAIRRIDANHANAAWKKNGRVVAAAQNVISLDGKTWTETIATRDAQGRDTVIVAVFDKQ
jgi:hypothetical protein